MQILGTIISKINVGDSQATDVKLTQNLLVKNVKQISVLSQGSLVRIFDRGTYKLDTGATLHFPASGGTIDASSQITSILQHGDGMSDAVGYSGNVVITRGVNIFPRQISGSEIITQNTSGLMMSLDWIQDAAE